MGTTLEALVIKGNTIVSAHVGDSRTYLMRDGELNKITTDHSLVQELVDAGQITEEEAEVHPNKNIITRSLGQTNEVQADIQALELQAGDIILMNSDGLTNMVSTTEIMEVLEREDLTLDNKSEALIRLANEHGGLDNITVVLIKFEETSEAETQAQEVS